MRRSQRFPRKKTEKCEICFIWYRQRGQGDETNFGGERTICLVEVLFRAGRRRASTIQTLIFMFRKHHRYFWISALRNASPHEGVLYVSNDTKKFENFPTYEGYNCPPVWKSRILKRVKNHLSLLVVYAKLPHLSSKTPKLIRKFFPKTSALRCRAPRDNGLTRTAFCSIIILLKS